MSIGISTRCCSSVIVFFFFQAEDGIRDYKVTGVQTCALPISLGVAIGSGTGDVETHREIAERLRTTGSMRRVSATVIPKLMASTVSANLVNVRSEERRVGKECRSVWWGHQ